jgi:YggT family protein
MFSEIFSLIFDTVSSLYLMIIILRFIFQMSRADFYNPISQFVVKATNPLLIPFRRIVPSAGGVDTASIVLAVIFQSLVISIKLLVLGGGLANPIFIIALSVVMILDMVLEIYFWSLIIMIISSWIAPGSGHPALVLINQIVEPIMQPFRKILPPMGGLDLSPIFAFLVIQVLEVVVKGLHAQVLSLA